MQRLFLQYTEKSVLLDFGKDFRQAMLDALKGVFNGLCMKRLKQCCLSTKTIRLGRLPQQNIS